ncbi:MAG: TetR/AcrR family transcriptional regulator [Pseudomonadota bacterium]
MKADPSNAVRPTPRPPGRPSLKKEKRDLLIQGATALFNSNGISAISIAEIAEKLGLARASVYHYVRDRADLVYQCYSRSCEQMADDLMEAAANPNGLARVCGFIERALTPDRLPVAVLSEINSLDASIADVIRNAHGRNIASLRRFIRMGIEDGSIRACDDEVIAQAIFGMLSWSQLLSDWSAKGRAKNLRSEAAIALEDLVSKGLAMENVKRFEFSFSVDGFRQSPGDVFNREHASRTKKERVLETASRLFNRGGIDATSLDEVTDELGVTKGVLYHYLIDKEDLVVKCYERALELQDRFIEVSIERGSNGLESALINAHLNIQAKASELSPLMPQPGFGSLPEDDQRRFKKIARRQNKTIARFLDQGIEAGIARSCYTTLVAHLSAGAFGWIPKWRDIDDYRSAIGIADEICDFLFAGLQAK